MKRIFALITTLFILFCGCAQTAEQPAETAAPPAEPQTSELTLLSDRNFSYIDDNGFYSLEDMGNGDFQNLMYSDFEQMKQRYLCDVEGCTHSDESCTSFVGAMLNANVFGYDGKLYFMYAVPNGDKYTAKIESREMDGTGREIIFEQASDDPSLGYPACTDGENLYWVGVVNGGYKVMKFSLADKTLVSTGQFGIDNYIFYMVWRNSFLSISWDENYTTLNAIDASDASVTTLHKWESDSFSFIEASVTKDTFNYVNPQTGEIFTYNVEADAETPLTSAFMQYATATPVSVMEASWINYNTTYWQTKDIGGYLFVSGNFISDELECKTLNKTTGEMTDMTLGDFWNGYVHPISIFRETPHGVLVISRHQSGEKVILGTGGDPYTVDASYPIYAFMTIEDLVSSTPNFREIVPVER